MPIIPVTLDAPLASVQVMVNSVPPTQFAVGDTLKSEGGKA